MNQVNEFQITEDINTIATFLAKRDINELSVGALYEKYGIEQVDLIIILGNSIPWTAELGAKAYKSGLSKAIMIAGGKGHATKYLIDNVLKDENYKNIDVSVDSEAEILKQIIAEREMVDEEKIIIESKSTNCGSNAHEALTISKAKGEIPKSVIIIQDLPMQYRSHASFIKEWRGEETMIISYSPFIPKVKLENRTYEFVNTDLRGLWDKDRFIDLIMGEIPRLKDDENGYGPKGSGYIEHVDIPEEVYSAYNRLLSYYSDYTEIKKRK